MNRAVAALVLACACQPPSATSPNATHPVQPARQVELLDLVGTWQWMHRAEEAATSRVEDERCILDGVPVQEAALINPPPLLG